ncbi:MAG: ABC transporter permease [Desulfovibrionales bacterium]|nr:ABC transporter permease [Desulfovibrionales bacterium]
MSPEILLSLLAATIQAGTPILFATLGEILTEKGGTLNMGVEGMMLVGALAGFLVALHTGSPVLAFVAGGLAGMGMAAVHGIVCIAFLGNQVVSGLALTIFGTGLAGYFGTRYIGQTAPGFDKFSLPILGELPVLGPILFQQDALVYTSYLIPPLMWAFLRYTRWGLGIRAAGESPAATRAAGLNVLGFRWAALLGGGILAGCGGSYLSLAYTHLWTNGLTSGRGWIAVALVIFAFWKPGRAMLGAYLFGGVMAFQLRLQAMGTALPSSILLMLPYVLTIAALAFSSWRGHRTEAPAALGVNVEPSE